MNHLFLFTISPVQPFIASARKTRDLYAGSQILSEMTKEAAKEAVNQGLTLVFPTKTDVHSFPNRFMAKIESETDLELKGETIKLAAINKFNESAKEALKKVSINEKTRGSFWKQIENYWDINWLFYPYKSDYKAAYKEIEPLMAALKNQRVIKNDFVEAGRKCSLDGQNNALFRGRGTENSALKAQAAEVDNTWLKPNEGLSAISLVKRAYPGGDGFKSTIEVALKKQLRKLKNKHPNLLDYYKKLFEGPEGCAKAVVDLACKDYLDNVSLNGDAGGWCKSYNEEFLVADNLTEKNIPNLTQLEIAKEVHRKHLKSALTDRYYALIAFDGDKMGKLLSGELLKNKDIDLDNFQGKVSELLMDYGKWIHNNLKDKIDIVYAGGDDFLGFVCLHDLFEVGKALREKFKKQVNDELQKEYPLTQEFTFSMGITIAHYKTPLSVVLQKTREMEKLAKNEEKGNRDAFAIAVLKHSGESHQAYYKWYEKDDEDGKESMKAWTALEKLVCHLQNDCSETFIRVLEREFGTLADDKGKIKKPKMIKTELFRLANKSLNDNKKALTAELTKQSWNLFPVGEDELEDEEVHVENAMAAMKISLFLKRKISKAS